MMTYHKIYTDRGGGGFKKRAHLSDCEVALHAHLLTELSFLDYCFVVIKAVLMGPYLLLCPRIEMHVCHCLIILRCVGTCVSCVYTVFVRVISQIWPTSHVGVCTVVPSSLGSRYRRDSGASVDHVRHLRLAVGAHEVGVDVSAVGHQLALPREGVGRLEELRGAVLTGLGRVGQERLRPFL